MKYTVKRGDTLFGIAARHGVRLADLLAVNTSLTDPNQLEVGDLLEIPLPDEPALTPVEAATPTVDVSRLLAFGAKVSPEFRTKVVQIAARIGVDPDFLMAVMAFESGGTFSPSVLNAAGSGAVGLIQFMPMTAKMLGTSTAELALMTAEQQLDYVEKYFRSHRRKLETLEDV